MSRLDALRWPELAGSGPRLLAIPVGATEQHGPHLPLWTDTAIAVALAERLAAARDDLATTAPIAFGASGEHAAFPGTLSAGHEALRLLLVELVRSADHFDGAVLVNGHGGNLPAVRSAAWLLRSEGRQVLTWSLDGPPGDTHAGRTETSAMLALHPGQVRLDLAEPGVTTPLPELIGELRSGGVAAVSPNGVLGDPRSATAADGHRILRRWTGDLVRSVAAWRS